MLVGAGPEVVPAAKQYSTEFKSKYGAEPRLFSMSTYLAVDLLMRGLSATGKKDQAAVVKWVRSNKHETIMGNISFNPAGEIIGFPWVIYKVKAGKFVPTAIWNAAKGGFDQL